MVFSSGILVVIKLLHYSVTLLIYCYIFVILFYYIVTFYCYIVGTLLLYGYVILLHYIATLLLYYCIIALYYIVMLLRLGKTSALSTAGEQLHNIVYFVYFLITAKHCVSGIFFIQVNVFLAYSLNK